MDAEIVGWFSTEDGTHIPLKRGQTKKEAIQEKFGSSEEEIKYLQSKHNFFQNDGVDQLEKYKNMIHDASTPLVENELNNFKSGYIVTSPNQEAQNARQEMIKFLQRELKSRNK